MAPAARAREHGRPRDIGAITTIVVHTVGGPACVGGAIRFKPIPFRSDDVEVWRRRLEAAPVADAHFVIGRSGAIAAVLPIAEVANHTVGANDVSIGIELVHRGNGVEPFEPGQIAALIGLIKRLRHDMPKIAFANIVGHDALDRRTCVCNGETFHRRQDPGANFPWDTVRAAVRLPDDPTGGKLSLTPLTGPAPETACPVHEGHRDIGSGATRLAASATKLSAAAPPR